jgi:hypothetical protein
MILGVLLTGSTAACSDEPVFSRDILPLLSEKCFACHGPDPDQRKADLRLDTREGAVLSAIVPGRPDGSELLRRVRSDDPEELMPPPDSHSKPLTPEQTALLERWIAAGAPWGKHWAFEPPVKVPLPDNQHPIDALINQRLQQEGLQPAPEAPRHTLLRRVSFDLTGLPPTPEELASVDAYETHVDRLLKSPHFGERMAMWWLDVARYSDTDGFQSDASRDNWPWRDWVIDAFNSNQPFDQFTLEQFAGDLLPGARPEQVLATCFHRNHMTNGEGGRDPEESRVDYVLDRVNTMGTAFLGLTLGCCQCHSHKFDPISQAEYYGLTAFFNSIDEDGKAGKAAKPYLSWSSPRVERAVVEAKQLTADREALAATARKSARVPFGEWLSTRRTEVARGFTAWQPLIGTAESTEGTLLNQAADGTIQASGPHPRQDDYRLIAGVPLSRVTGVRLEVLPHTTHTGGRFTRGVSGEFILTDVKVQVRRRGISQVRDIAIRSATADFSPDQKEARAYGDIRGILDDDPRNGWTTRGAPDIQPHFAVLAFAEPLVLQSEEELIIELRQRSTDGDANLGRFRLLATDQPGPAVSSVGPAPLEELAGLPTDQLPGDQLRERLFEQFLADHAPYQQARQALDRAMAQLKEVEAARKVDVMVLAERSEPRPTFVLQRGVWDQHGEQVRRGGLSQIAPLEGTSLTRLDLARWLTAREHPLTARVLVNHLWQLCFGTGLVRTQEDFGLQGERPEHPQLLDWMAVECMESGWDIRHMLRLIVTSATYRRSSVVTPELLTRDPENRLLARGARFRLSAWMLRDAALRASGLLNPALGGPPVRPYQPPGVWEENFMGRFTWVPSDGPAQYRRTVYAFWRRSIAPTFLFDTAQRRTCEVRAVRTNTPLQALTLLNDENFLDAAQAAAAAALQQSDPIADLSLRILSRPPTADERRILGRERDRAIEFYRGHADEARLFLQRGQNVVDAATSTEELASRAAHTVVASLLLNLDEAVTHE